MRCYLFLLGLFGFALHVVGNYYAQGLQDFEMKPKVVSDLAQYQRWHAFDRQIGPYIS